MPWSSLQVDFKHSDTDTDSYTGNAFPMGFETARRLRGVVERRRLEGRGIDSMLSLRERLIRAKDLLESYGYVVTMPPEESAYDKALRTGERPEIWPPIVMTREELDHFRASLRQCRERKRR